LPEEVCWTCCATAVPRTNFRSALICWNVWAHGRVSNWYSPESRRNFGFKETYYGDCIFASSEETSAGQSCRWLTWVARKYSFIQEQSFNILSMLL
jgi:hypothetical protein